MGERLRGWLSRWSGACPTPVVLLLDEADVITGPPLVSLLRQLRAGFSERPGRFPASISLIGMRDLRDYLTTSKGGERVNPGTPFNIKYDPITLRNLTADEVAGMIHSDFERGFIRAEVYGVEDLVAASSEAALKSQGKLRVEGKEYLVQDGDVMPFRLPV